MQYESGHRIGFCAVFLAALSANCGVYSRADDCTQLADCLDESDAGTLAAVDSSPDARVAARDAAVDAASEPTTSDASSRPEAASDGPPDGTLADARADAFDASGEDVSPETGAHDASAGCVPTGPEICNNGLDDDCNGKIDCADPACSSLSCAPPVPTGWLGPVAFWQGAAGAPAPACPPSFTHVLDANGGLGASATTCGCTCTASGQVCMATGSFYSDQACGSAACATVAPSSAGACSAVSSNNCGSNGSFSLTGVSASGGSCAPQVTSTIPPAEWTTSARLCSYAGPADIPGGCAAGDRCLSAPASPFSARACIYSTGSPPASCPAGYAAAPPAVFYSGFSDSRACGACSCGQPTGGSCSGNVDLYGGNACDGPSSSYTVGAFCVTYAALSPAPSSVQAHYVVSPGACAVQSPPSPTGAVTPTGPVSVCCM